MNRYENGKIYKIVDIGYNKCYIGSTCESLSQRMTRHRHQYNSHLKGLYGRTCSFELFDEYGIENCKIELIENYPCNDKEELRRREGQYIETINCVNKQIAGRTPQEYRDGRKDVKREKDKEYRENHKEELKQKKEEKREYYTEHKRMWNMQNKEYVADYNKEYRMNNKEKLAEKATCEICGSVVRKYDIKKHQETPKCKSYTKTT